MNKQCNFCGGFNDISSCARCHALVCAKCAVSHESACKVLQPLRRSNAGATVRQFGTVPERELFKGHINLPVVEMATIVVPEEETAPVEPTLTVVPPIEVAVPVASERPTLDSTTPVVVTKTTVDVAEIEAVLAEHASEIPVPFLAGPVTPTATIEPVPVTVEPTATVTPTAEPIEETK
jgi:hypothetical protein